MPEVRLFCVGRFILSFLVAAALVTVAPRAQSQSVSVPSSTQSEQARSSAADLINEGFRLYGMGETEPARQRFEAALSRAVLDKNPADEAEARRGLALTFLRNANYPAAQKEVEKALPLFQSTSDRLGVARVEKTLAEIARQNGDLKRSRELYRKVIAEFHALGAWRDKMFSLHDYSFVATNEEVTGLRAEGLELARKLADKRMEGLFLQSEGDSAFTEGHFAKALQKLEQASQLLEALNARGELAGVFTSLGRLHRAHGQAERALPFYERALKIQIEIGDQRGAIQSINAMGVAYSNLGKHRESLERYEHALRLAEQTGSQRIINFQRGALATAYAGLGNHAAAITLLEQVLAEPIEPQLAAYRYTALGNSYFAVGRHADALQALDKGVAYAKDTKNFEYLVKPLYDRAYAKQKLGRQTEALPDVQEALGLIEGFRERLAPADFMRRGFGDNHQKLFALAVALHHQLGKQDEALQIAEHARARAFLDLLATREIQPKPADRVELAALRNLEKTLKGKGINPEELADGPLVGLTLRGADAETRAHWQNWQKADAQLKSLVSAQPVSIQEIGATAARLRSTLLSYWVTPEAIYIWVIKPHGVIKSVRVPLGENKLAELVRNTWAGLSPESSRGPTAAAVSGEAAHLLLRGGDSLALGSTANQAYRELHKLLIQPISRLLPPPGSRLTIIPHGPLFFLSFAALQDPRGLYLLEHYSIHYVPSVGLLKYTASKKRARKDESVRYLLVADAGIPHQESLPPLPGARREVAGIARLLPKDSVTVLTGEKAQEREIRRILGDQTIVHLATHGIVRDDEPLASFLAVGGSGTPEENDGRLTAAEIYGLDLAADLVVLSACRSGRGELSGDGIVGLTRAFFYAGSPSVIASLWDVADEPTGLLLRDFYRALSRQQSKSGALRQAQLRLLQQLRAGRVNVKTAAGPVKLPEHPAFWAGFVLQGEP